MSSSHFHEEQGRRRRRWPHRTESTVPSLRNTACDCLPAATHAATFTFVFDTLRCQIQTEYSVVWTTLLGNSLFNFSSSSTLTSQIGEAAQWVPALLRILAVWVRSPEPCKGGGRELIPLSCPPTQLEWPHTHTHTEHLKNKSSVSDFGDPLT